MSRSNGSGGDGGRQALGHPARLWERLVNGLPYIETALLALLLPLLIFAEALRPLAPLAATGVVLMVLGPLLLGERVSLGLALTVPLALLAAMTALGVAVAADAAPAMPRAGSIVAGLLCFWWAARRLRGQDSLLLAVLALVLAASGASLLGLALTAWQPGKLFTAWPVYDALTRLRGEPAFGGATVFHANEVGATAAQLILPALALLLYRRHGGALPWRRAAPALTVLALALLAGVLILSQSRASLLAAAAGLLALAAFSRPAAARRLAPLILVGGLAGMVILAGAGDLLRGLGRATLLVGSLSDSGENRLEIWQNALYVAVDYPLTGLGLNAFPAVTRAAYGYQTVPAQYALGHAHNLYLQAAADLGLPGLAAFLWLAALLLWRAWRMATQQAGPQRYLLAGLAAMLAAALAGGLLDATARPLGAKPGFLFWMGAGALAAAWESRPVRGASPHTGRLAVIALPALLAAALWLLPGAVAVNQANLALDQARLAPELGEEQRRQALRSAIPALEASTRWGERQWLRLGQAWLAVGDEQAALDAWRHAPLAARYLQTQGQALWQLGRPEEALAFYALSLTVAPNAAAYAGQGRALEDLHEPALAIAAYRAALVAQAGPATDSRLRLARLVAQSEGPAAAMLYVDEAISAVPGSGAARAAKADVLDMAAGETHPGTAYLAETAAGWSGDVALYRALVERLLAAGRSADAEHWAKAAGRAAPGSGWPHVLLGRVQAAQGRFSEALHSFRRAALVRRDLPEPLTGMAAIYLAWGDAATAHRLAAQAVQRDPRSAAAFAALGQAALASGDRPAARTAFARALAIDPRYGAAGAGLAAAGD